MTTFPRFAFASLAAALFFCSRAEAQITVTTLEDENDTPAGAQISLREALRDAAADAQISFDASLAGKVLVLTGGELVVTGKTVSVTAPAAGLVIEARQFSRIFRVESGAGLSLTGLTLQGGKAPADGGAILSVGPLSLTDCVLRDNAAAEGATGVAGAVGAPSQISIGGPGGPGGSGSNGGAVSSSGSLTAVRCHFVRNTAGQGGLGGQGGAATDLPGGLFPSMGGNGGAAGSGGSGGAIYSTGALTLQSCIFESNQSGGGGNGGGSFAGGGVEPIQPGSGGWAGNSGEGGAVVEAGDMTVESCTFFRNVCGNPGTPGFGGGINPPHGGPGNGTAIVWNNGTATFTNCTLSDNGSDENATNLGASARGGVIYCLNGTLLQLVHCTITANVVGSASTIAGIYSSAPVECQNCIISGNLRNTGQPGQPNWITDNFSQSTSRTVIPFNSPGVDSADMNLDLLAITSGSLPVRPRPLSPALNTGAATSLSTDQRGLPRAIGVPDLGAVEVQADEAPRRDVQEITFTPPPTPDASSLTLSGFASSGLPVSFDLISGPAVLSGDVLTFTGAGLVVVRASQAGDSATAPALPVARVIAATHFLPAHFISFAPADSYTAYAQSETVVTLPDVTSRGLPVTWTFVDEALARYSISGNKLTATGPGTVRIRGQNPGNAEYPPVDAIWTLSFVQGPLWWDTPPPLVPGWPLWFTLVEGSPHGILLTARIQSPHSAPVAVLSLPAGFTATPSAIPAGEVSIQCVVTLTADPQLTVKTVPLLTGNPGASGVTLFLAGRTQVPLGVFAPAQVAAGTSFQVDVAAPGLPAGALYGPPPDLGLRTLSVRAVDADNPALAIPVTLDATTADAGPFPQKHLHVTFPQGNHRATIIVSTDDGITGNSSPVQIGASVSTETDADRDGINDIVETALQHTPDHADPPPLTIERDEAGLHAILASRPLDLKGWTVIIETSPDLQNWSPASVAATTTTPNPGNTTERVSVLLSGFGPHFVRLRAAKP